MPEVAAYRGMPSGGVTEDAARRWADFLDGEDVEGFSLGANTENLNLLLPSDSICIANCLSTGPLVEKESRLRLANMEVSLCELRRLLRIKASVYLHKKRNSVGQRSGTRSATLLSDYTARIDFTAARYRQHRGAVLRMDPDGSWRDRLKELKPADVRAAHQNESDTEETGRSSKIGEDRRVWNESRRSISWIWKVPRAVGDGILGEDEVVATDDEVGEGKRTPPPSSIYILTHTF